VAKIGAAFLSGRMPFEPTFRRASYINTWLKMLNSHPRATFTAGSFAGQAPSCCESWAMARNRRKPSSVRLPNSEFL